jgi:hypothetical protein
MIRLTILYNLPPDADEDEFLRWRLAEGQEANAGAPGVICTDFARTIGAWPPGTEPRYRFMTTADWPDWESFNAGFYLPEVQSSLLEDVKLLQDPVFLVSEILISDDTGAT